VQKLPNILPFTCGPWLTLKSFKSYLW
jgi:hypothetical protein